MHMLTAASSLGYTPSTLSLIRILTQAGNVKLTERREMFRDTVARFKQLLQTGKNPDALTLQGLLLLREGNDTYALKYFDQAIEAARSKDSADQQLSPAVRKPRWSYEGSCHQQRGLVLMKQGQREAATAAFKTVALELNLAEGYLELAKLLPQNAPERETYLIKAAQAGKFEACERLALDAIDKAVEPGLSQADRKYAAKMAYEWALIEPKSDKREKLTSLVAERFKGVGGLEGGLISTLWSRLVSRPAR
jgi:Tfp pilus assembly protein PilF